MADIRWNIPYKGELYEFDATRDLTAGVLRQAKGWFGSGYGQWSTLLGLLTAGDADAWSLAIWICLKKEGKPRPSNPTMIDFPVGELMDGLEAIETEDDTEESPTRDGATPASERTSTGSEGEPSGS